MPVQSVDVEDRDVDEDLDELEEPTRRRSYSHCRDAVSHLGKATTDKGKYLQILLARRAFEGLPIGKQNDMVTGSWWFVWGSLVSAFIPIPCLIDIYHPVFSIPEGTALKAFDEASTWFFLILSGLGFTFGSYAFVRAFEDPPRKPLLGKYYHFQTDELLGAWLYLVAVLPAVPFTIIYLKYNPARLTYWGAFFCSILIVLGSAGFVKTAYPHDGKDSGAPGAAKVSSSPSNTGEKKMTHIALPLFRLFCGSDSWIIKHVENDWLACCWFFFWASVFVTVGSWVLLLAAENDRQLFVWITGLLDSLMFTVGSAYFCAGSYPPPKDHKNTDHDVIAAGIDDIHGVNLAEMRTAYGLDAGLSRPDTSIAGANLPAPRHKKKKPSADEKSGKKSVTFGRDDVRIISPVKAPSGSFQAHTHAHAQQSKPSASRTLKYESVSNPIHSEQLAPPESASIDENGYSEVDVL